jgi:hypothetical protein
MYFIYDCNGSIIGNPKGYRTFRGAERQQNTRLKAIIWDRFDVRVNKDDTQLCSIKFLGA